MSEEKEAALRKAKRAAADPDNVPIPWEEAKAWLRRIEERDDSSENKQMFVEEQSEAPNVRFE